MYETVQLHGVYVPPKLLKIIISAPHPLGAAPHFQSLERQRLTKTGPSNKRTLTCAIK